MRRRHAAGEEATGDLSHVAFVEQLLIDMPKEAKTAFAQTLGSLAVAEALGNLAVPHAPDVPRVSPGEDHSPNEYEHAYHQRTITAPLDPEVA